MALLLHKQGHATRSESQDEGHTLGTAIKMEGHIMQTNSQRTDVAMSPIKSEILKENQFHVNAVPPGSAVLIGDVMVFHAADGFCATQANCPHRQRPLSEGKFDGATVTCPWHGSQFNVCTGAVLRGPAVDPLKTYRVTVEGEIGQVVRA
jgi:nitrite reductase/ring-hydroxylating ferredoxin subunit